MQTIRIPSETCSETALPQMYAFWIRIRQRSQPLRGRGRIVGGASHSFHLPFAIFTVLPEGTTSFCQVINGDFSSGRPCQKSPATSHKPAFPIRSRGSCI